MTTRPAARTARRHARAIRPGDVVQLLGDTYTVRTVQTRGPVIAFAARAHGQAEDTPPVTVTMPGSAMVTFTRPAPPAGPAPRPRSAT